MPTMQRAGILAALSILFIWGPAFAASDEEFNGPLPSWRDVKRDYGAVGDGKADDTPAIQRGLDDLQKHEKSVVLYIPAGIYRITQTLSTKRAKHTDYMGVRFVGENSATTKFVWDGLLGGTMIKWDAWYSCIGRFTLDAGGKAEVGLQYGPGFSTNNQTNDLIFKDFKTGLLFGGEHYQGQAENEVLRCQFLHCDTGIMTAGWNSMDIWVWYCQFEDCNRGVHNVMGNWHCWQSLFLHSRTADLSTINLMAFSAVNNTSIGSKCFFDFSTGHTWGSPTSVTGNRVINPTGDWGMILTNAGPYLVADNQFLLGGKARGVKMTWGDQTLVGNIYTKPDAVEEKGRFRRIAERVADPTQISDAIPSLPASPDLVSRKTIEVPADSSGDVIQNAIDDAVAQKGNRPIIHLPMGKYRIARTLVIPAGADLQLIGDGSGETATRLEWAGPGAAARTGDDVVLRLAGPSHATLRDFYINAGGARAMLIDNADQPGGKIFADELNVNGPTQKRDKLIPSPGLASVAPMEPYAAISVNGLTKTDVLMRCLQGSGNKGSWVRVTGSRDVPEPKNQVSIFTGATGSAAGQYDVAKNGKLVVRGVYHERSSDSLSGLHLADAGTLSIDATRFSYATSASAPTVGAENFHGLFTLATCILLPVETKDTCRFEITGDGSHASMLALNDQFVVIEPGTTSDTVWQNRATPPAHGGLVGCNINTSNKQAAPGGFQFLPNIGDDPDPAKSVKGAGPLDDRGRVDDATILRHLAPLREARVWLPNATKSPPDVTDVRIYRVMATGGHGAVVEVRGL